MCIQWKAGQPYEDGRLMDYDALATWARSLEAGLEQLAQLPEGGSARALLVRSTWNPQLAYISTRGGHCSLPFDHTGPCVR